MKVIATVVKVLLLVIAVLFAVFNTMPINIVLLPGYVRFDSIPLFLPLIIAFLVGGLLATILFLTEKFAKAQELKSYKKRIATLEGELEKLRNLPLSSDTTANNKG